MARIAGVNIPNNAHIVIGLQAIYGIGNSRAKLRRIAIRSFARTGCKV